MSDVGSIGRSSSSNTLVGIDVKEVAADENTKKEVGKLTGMKQLEGVQPETTGHKARRIIAGILGGLLLAAGIAAATVATTASFGLAAGILGTIAAFTGITGASVAAGAAGTAGIALIATSAHMAPEHAEDAISESGASKTNKEEIADEGVDEDNTEIGEEGSTTKEAEEIAALYEASEDFANVLRSAMGSDKKSLKDSDALDKVEDIKIFVQNVFEAAEISADNVTKDGVNAVKNAIKTSSESYKKLNANMRGRPAMVDVFNSPEFKNKLADHMKGALKDISAQDAVLINTFIEALSSDEDQAPQEQQQQNVIFG